MRSQQDRHRCATDSVSAFDTLNANAPADIQLVASVSGIQHTAPLEPDMNCPGALARGTQRPTGLALSRKLLAPAHLIRSFSRALLG